MKPGRTLAVMVAVLFLATFLRFNNIDVQSFWNDEGNSARLSERSLDLIIEGTASDIHPPLYYLMLRGWRELFGDSEFALRSMSAFLGITLVAVTYGLGKQLIRKKPDIVSILAALFVAINPALIYYGQETRMYGLLAFLAAFSTLLLVSLLQKESSRTMLAIAYAVTIAAGLYTHYFFPVVLFIQALIVLIVVLPPLFRGRKLRSNPRFKAAVVWLAALAVAAVLYSPWVPIFWRQAGGRQGAREGLLQFLADSGRWLGFGSTIDADAASWSLVALSILLLLGLIALWKYYSRTILLAVILLSIIVPVLAMWVIGTTQLSFYKFMLMVIPYLSLLVAMGVAWAWSSFETIGVFVKVLLVVLVGVVLWGGGTSIWNMNFDPDYARADYRAMATRIDDEAHPNAGVLLNAANQWEVFTYYHHKDAEDVTSAAPLYPIPRGYPDPSIIDAELSDIATQHDRIYAIFWGEAERDPARLVERWLDENSFKAGDDWYGDVRFVTYAVPDDPISELENSFEALFGDHIRLRGYSLHSNEMSPGEIVQLTLFWNADAQINERYKVFVHLVDDSGKIVAQHDSEPGGGLVLTNNWEVGEMVRDNHGLLLPADIDPGSYTLILGMYELGDPANRLPVIVDQNLTDVLELTVVAIKES